MNCKRGDLAVVVRSMAGNEGRLVSCIRLARTDELIAFNVRMDCGPAWVIGEKLMSSSGGLIPIAIDAWLRPIRDQDGEDETLTWAGKPNEVKETA